MADSVTAPADNFLQDINNTLVKSLETYANVKTTIAQIKGKNGKASYVAPPAPTPTVLPTATNYTPYIIGGAAIIALVFLFKGRK